MNVLNFEHVGRTFGHGQAACPALHDVSFDLPAGCVAALMGASGSGKTTLLNLGAALDAPTSGSVRLFGEPTAGLNETQRCLIRRARLGFVFQSFNLLGTLSAEDNVQFPLVLNGWAPADRRKRVAELLDLAGLADKRLKYPDELSSGQQQRVAVLRAIAHLPKLMLMDEPTSCLDSAHAAELMDLVTELNRREGSAILIATHDPAVAGRAQKVIRLRDGRIEQE